MSQKLLGERPLGNLAHELDLHGERVLRAALKSEIDGLLLGGARHATRLPVKSKRHRFVRIRLAVDCVIGCRPHLTVYYRKVLVWLITSGKASRNIPRAMLRDL